MSSEGRCFSCMGTVREVEIRQEKDWERLGKNWNEAIQPSFCQKEHVLTETCAYARETQELRQWGGYFQHGEMNFGHGISSAGSGNRISVLRGRVRTA